MSFESFIKKYTDPTNHLNILCDKNILIQYIKSNKIIKKYPNTFILWKNDNMDLIKSYFDDYQSITDWSDTNKLLYYKNKLLPIPTKYGKPNLVELITIKASILWKSVDDDIKIEYDLKREQHKKSINHTDTIFENYSTPYNGYIIKNTLKQNGKTIKVFTDIYDAIHVSNELGDTCYGITQTKSGKYSLRYGSLVKDASNQCSWVKTNFKHHARKRGRPKTRVNSVSDSDTE